MTASKPTHRRVAALWQTLCRAAAAPRTLHDEQVLIWEPFWQSSRVAVGRTGPLACTLSLDGPRLTGSHLPMPDSASTRNTP